MSLRETQLDSMEHSTGDSAQCEAQLSGRLNTGLSSMGVSAPLNGRLSMRLSSVGLSAQFKGRLSSMKTHLDSKGRSARLNGSSAQ